VAALLKTQTTAELMDYIVATTSPTGIVTQCHSIAHVIGEQTRTNSRSLEEALNRCTNDCLHGCVHGAIGAEVAVELGGSYAEEDVAHADVKKIEDIGTTYCARSNNLCHGIGHILYMNTNDYTPALAACDMVGNSNASKEGCYAGVFMESAGARDSLVFSTTTKKGPHDDYLYPCDTISAKYQFACFQHLPTFEGHALSANGITASSSRIAVATKTCQSLPTPLRAYCFEGLAEKGGDVSSSLAQIAGVKTFCNNLPIEEDRYSCTYGLVLKYDDLFLNTEAVQYCQGLNDSKLKQFCMKATDPNNIPFGPEE
jgi:hypothetical protein